MSSQVAVAVASSIGVVFAAVVAGIFLVKRNNISGAKEITEGAKEITEAALLLVAPQADQMVGLIEAVGRLRDEVHSLKFEVGVLRVHVDGLSEQIISLGEIPIPTPVMEQSWNL